jgi:hypothetical protein
MPTGYTHDVQNGKITEFSDFAIDCSRAMGANIMMRDDPSGATIKEYEPSTYDIDRLREDEAELKEIKAMTVEECDLRARKEYTEAVARHKEYAKEADEFRARYQSMLDKLEAWQPPTPEHENFKKFMRDQLTDSIDHDCDTSYYEATEISGADWKEQNIFELERSIPRHRECHQEELKRTDERNKWNGELWKSLKK